MRRLRFIAPEQQRCEGDQEVANEVDGVGNWKASCAAHVPPVWWPRSRMMEDWTAVDRTDPDYEVRRDRNKQLYEQLNDHVTKVSDGSM